MRRLYFIYRKSIKLKHESYYGRAASESRNPGRCQTADSLVRDTKATRRKELLVVTASLKLLVRNLSVRPDVVIRLDHGRLLRFDMGVNLVVVRHGAVLVFICTVYTLSALLVQSQRLCWGWTTSEANIYIFTTPQ